MQNIKSNKLTQINNLSALAESNKKCALKNKSQLIISV